MKSGCLSILFIGLGSFYFFIPPSTIAENPITNAWDIYGRFPVEIKRTLKGGKADDRGMVSHNQPHYLGAEYQRGGMDTLLAGIITHDTKMIDEGFRVANATFQLQKADGSFGDKVPTGAAFWITAFARTLLVLKESEYWVEYQTQAETYFNALALADGFLVKNIDQLMKHDKNTPNRLLIDADALYLSAQLLGTLPPPEAARLRDAGLALFDVPTGAFQENGGGDSSYQAVNLQMLMYYVTYYPSADIDKVIHLGLEWELSKIEGDGRINAQGNSRTGLGQEVYFGKAKEVNHREVSLVFAYAGALYHDDVDTETAMLIQDHYRKER